MGMRWDSADTVRFEIRPELINAGGLLSGVVTYALVDYCMGSTLWPHTTEEEHIATLNISINYIQTAIEGEIVCKTELDRRNRTNAVLRSEVRHEDGRLLVSAIGSYAIFPARKRPPRALTRPRGHAGHIRTHSSRADHRRIGFWWRRGHTGRPQGLRALRGPRYERDHRDHGTEHARCRAPFTRSPPRSSSLRFARWLRTSAWTPSRWGCLAASRSSMRWRSALDELPAETPVVVDPVMVSESGARLLDRDAESALVAEILPRATHPDAERSRGPCAGRLRSSSRGTGEQIADEGGGRWGEAIALAYAVSLLGPRIVVLTGGHRAQAIDLFLARGAKPEQVVEIPGERYPDGAAHGSGCTHSSVLAAQLALGRAPLQAAFARPVRWRERLSRTVCGTSGKARPG